MTLKVIVIRKGPIALTKSEANKMKAETMGHIAGQWDVRFRPSKFTAAGARKWNYAKRRTKNIRTGKINRDSRGKPRAPDARPLVWTRQSLSLSKTHTIYSSRSRSRVTYPIRIFNRNKKINLADEFRRVNPADERQLGGDGEKFLRRKFKRGKKNAIVFSIR